MINVPFVMPRSSHVRQIRTRTATTRMRDRRSGVTARIDRGGRLADRQRRVVGHVALEHDQRDHAELVVAHGGADEADRTAVGRDHRRAVARAARRWRCRRGAAAPAAAAVGRGCAPGPPSPGRGNSPCPGVRPAPSSSISAGSVRWSVSRPSRGRRAATRMRLERPDAGGGVPPSCLGHRRRSSAAAPAGRSGRRAAGPSRRRAAARSRRPSVGRAATSARRELRPGHRWCTGARRRRDAEPGQRGRRRPGRPATAAPSRRSRRPGRPGS